MRNNKDPQKNVIDVRNLTRRFGDFTAVDNISFEVARGSIFGFLGPNGSGKTTTIRMLLGLLAPTSGKALVLGSDIRHQALSIRARLGYMSQKFTLYNDLTVTENLLFYGRGYGLRNRQLRERMGDVLELASLRGRENETPPHLSGGWRQRLALGAAIMHQPEIVFLDEPTAGVDPLSRRAFWDLLYRIASEGTTIFITTHYMDEAEHCENLAFIYQGKIIAQGAPHTIKHSTLPGEVIQITPAQVASAMALLQEAHANEQLADSLGVFLYGAQIHIPTKDPAATKTCALDILKTGKEAVLATEIIPPSLEDAFIQLVETHRGQN